MTTTKILPTVAKELAGLDHAPVASLEPFQGDLKELSQREYNKLKKSILENGLIVPFFVWLETNKLLDGHQRQRVFIKEGWLMDVPIVYISAASEQDAKRKLLVISSQYGRVTQEGWDAFTWDLEDDWLKETVQFDALPFVFDLPPQEPEEDSEAEARKTLAERFVVPPFSVLDARQGYWQDRKRAWLALGLKGEAGRDAGMIGGGVSVNDPNFYKEKNKWESESGKKISTTEFRETFYAGAGGGLTSVFDPVLAECLYRWFCPAAGHIINPTAGESVYGIVAGVLGYSYEGVELRLEQVEENRQQAIDTGCQDLAKWIHGDGRNTGELVQPADFIINCPPYHDLEVYSDDPNDISTINDYNEFMTIYDSIVLSTVGALKENRFAAVVVGDIRDKKGNYKNFVSDTISAFLAAGCKLYNEAILVTPQGSTALRAGWQFAAGRKLGKTHQNVLVFVKGDSREAVNACGDVEVHLPDGFGENI